MIENLYNRQESLDLNIPKSVCVVGVGGVGSWVALDLTLAGVPRLFLIDPDRIEDTNLNRTPFTYSQIGKSKVKALTELIFERRPLSSIFFFEKNVEQLSPLELESMTNVEVVVDCRDVSSRLPEILEGKTLITGGYDGLSITMHVNPSGRSVWGEPVTYTIVPSFVAPPQLIATLITMYLCMKPEQRLNSEKIATFDMSEFVREIFLNS